MISPNEQALSLAQKRSFSRLIGWSILLTVLVGAIGFTLSARSTEGHLAWSDGLAYFLFPRSLLLDGNFDLTNEYAQLSARCAERCDWMDQLRDWSWEDPESQRRLTPWPAGIGFLMVPFYALGYGAEALIAPLQGRAVDSYGLIPQIGFASGSLVYALIGFWSIVGAARRLGHRDEVALLTALGVCGAGPLAFYVFLHPTMAHAVSFGLVAIATSLFLGAWTSGVRTGRFLALCVLCGLLITVRFQNALFGLLPAALMIRLVFSHPGRAFGLSAVGVLASAIPLVALFFADGLATPPPAPIDAFRVQPGPWQVQLGLYPFDLRSPYFLDVLLSCRHGAFHWAPILAVASAGLLIALLRRQGWAIVLLLTLAAQVYLIGALGLIGSGYAFDDWLNHWGGATSFGMRYLVESTPLFAPGLAWVLGAIVRFGQALLAWLAIGLVVAWNGLLMALYGLGLISRSECVSYGQMIDATIDLIKKLVS